MASFEDGSSLRYHELVVGAAFVHVAGRVTVWPSRLYVDSPASLAGGREVWGLPKELATFEIADDERSRRVVVRDERARPLYRFIVRRPGWRVPLRIPVSTFGLHDGRTLFFTAWFRARIGFVRAEVESEYAESAPLLAVAFDDLDLVVHAPKRKAS